MATPSGVAGVTAPLCLARNKYKLSTDTKSSCIRLNRHGNPETELVTVPECHGQGKVKLRDRVSPMPQITIKGADLPRSEITTSEPESKSKQVSSQVDALLTGWNEPNNKERIFQIPN